MSIAALAAAVVGAIWSPGVGATLYLCDRAPELTATQQDRLLRFAAIVKDELARSGTDVALIGRSGLDLQRFGIRYSHAGVSLKASANTSWSVRQLYFACDERRPRIFDQGLAGFLMGGDDPTRGFVSVVLLPESQASEVERAARDDAAALRLLAPDYSANAYAFSDRYQNCNQWLVELLASTWRGQPHNTSRKEAQQWLIDAGYQPEVLDVGPLLMWAGSFVSWIHNDDHPRADLERNQYRVSLPEAIERFVHQRVPQARRIEFCHSEQKVVVRHGWQPIVDACVPAEGDRLIELQ